MKCPKCSYISFDYNQACPRCSKDISLEQEKLNIPAFKPNPPSLLNSLLGDGAQSDVHPSGSEGMHATHQVHSHDENTVRLDEPFLNDSQEIDLGPELQEESRELELEAILEEPGQGNEVGSLQDEAAARQKSRPQEKSEISGTIFLEENEVFPGQESEKEEPAEISLDLEEITLDSGEQAETGQRAGQVDDSLEIDLGDFSLEDAGEETMQPSAAVTGAQTSDQGIEFMKEEKAPQPETDEITLSLDDLKVNNETGQLEIGKFMADLSARKEPGEMEGSNANSANRPPADPESEDDLSLLLGDDAIEIPADSESVESLDLENLDLELDLEGPERK